MPGHPHRAVMVVAEGRRDVASNPRLSIPFLNSRMVGKPSLTDYGRVAR
jgi:hypothetical protein